MRRFNILFAFAAILLTSCVIDDVDFTGSYNPSSKGGIHIVGTVEDFDVKTVGTRADDDDIADSYISEMTMFIFKGDDNLIQGYTDATFTTECTSAINIQRGNPTFLIDTEEGILADLSGTSGTSMVYYNNNADDLGSCNIYIVANAWHQLSAGEVGSRPVDSIKTLSDLEAFVYQVDGTLAMPMIDESHPRGFPMIGKQQGGSFKLKKGDDNEGNAVATIPLKKLYSKVRFTMQINADQIVDKQIPTFKISKAEVFNVPTMARLGRELDVNGKPVYGTTNVDDYVTEMGVTGTYTPSDYYHFTSEPYTINTFVGNKTTISHSTSATTDDIIEFSFYMPEHKVMPNNITYPFPTTTEKDLEEYGQYRQYYKPAGVGQSRNGDGSISSAKIATFVRIHGSYTDHNGQILGVKYDIYLGQNNYNDFTIKRNQQLNNKLIITGLTNHKDAYGDVEGNISIDHRVEVEDKGFNLSMEREAILDSHFEVRPLDVELSPGGKMTVVIPDTYKSWLAMESDAAAYTGTNSPYVSDSDRKGVRKYFTTNLVSDLNGTNGGTVTVAHSGANPNKTEIHRIWFYIDENPNVYDKTLPGQDESGNTIDYSTNNATDSFGTTYNISKNLYRLGKVNFFYSGDGTDPDTSSTPTTIVNFQQWNLWRVWSADGKRYYDIEHEEEYLNNYASDQQYGQTQNGMPWGLEGIQLSDSVMAYWAEKVEHSTGDGIWDLIAGFIVGLLDSWLDITGNANKIFAQSNLKPYYDFYLTRDNFPIAKLQEEQNALDYQRDFSGLAFNKEIAATLKSGYSTHQIENNDNTKYPAQIDKILLTQDPQSAFAYCYHKNKRNANGVVENQKWFLPAIDEIEDIALGAYAEFDKVFQNQIYWSCQPAYDSNSIVINPYRGSRWSDSYTNYSKYITVEGAFYDDNLYRARATSVYSTDGTTYQAIKSGLPNDVLSGKLTVNAYSDGPKDGQAETNYDEYVIDYSATLYTTGEYRGNKSRSDIARIRAVYRSGKVE